MKINGTMTSMLVYSGAEFTVSGLRGNLISEERNLRVYQYGNECLTRWSVNVKLQLSAMGKKWSGNCSRNAGRRAVFAW